MKKTVRWALGIVVILVLGYGALHSLTLTGPSRATSSDYKDATYVIDGQHIQLRDGVAQSDAAPGSASKITTRYFGNDLTTDLNDDGREDIVFLLTQHTGGSGTFYYVVAALNTDHGPVGSDGYFLGDRIAPQTIDVSRNPQQRHVIEVNYADRMPGEPMTAQPSLGKTAYLKLNLDTMQWGIVLAPEDQQSL